MQDRDQRLKSAVADHDAGRLAEAERGYRGLLADRADDAEAMHLLGVLLHQSGRNDQALELIRRSLELEGSRPNVHSNLASVLGRTGRTAEALHHVREALRLSPNLPEAHNNLGVTLEGMNRPKEAEPAYRKAIELRPTYAEAHHHLGNSLRKQGRMDEAAAAHRHAVSLRPAYADAWAALGNVLMEQGLSEEGVDCLRRAAELAPAPAAGSALLYTMHYLSSRHVPELSAAHFAWAARHAEPLGRDVAMAVQPNSEILLAGVDNGNSFALSRYLPASGTLDPNFGTNTPQNGIASANFGGGATDEAYAVALDPSGDIIAVGSRPQKPTSQPGPWPRSCSMGLTTRQAFTIPG
jgi:Flp pilus assembly protein TadD